MGHRAAGRDVVVAVGHDAGGAVAAADVRGACAVYRTVIALRAAGAELKHRAALGGTGDAAGLGGDQRLLVDCQQDHSFQELGLNHRAGNRDNRLAGEDRGALRHGPDVAFELEIF